MKLNEQNTEHLELIAKYLANELDENERANFEIDIALDPENARLINEIKKDWKMLGNSNRHKKVDSNKAWNRLSDRLEDENLVPNQPTQRRPFMSTATKYGIWAAACLVGVIVFWTINHHQKPNMISVFNSNSDNTVVETLMDGSIVYLANNSTLRFPEQFSNKVRTVELKGQAFFDVAHNPNKPFIIETEDAYIQVLGTAFNVKSYSPSSFELIVQRGKVKVTLKADETVSQVVVAGEKIAIDQNKLVKNHWNDDGSLSWKLGQMQFKDETLQNIVTVINRNYEANILIPNSETANRRLTVTFHDNSLTTITQLLCAAMDLHEERIGNQIVLSANNGQ